MKITFTHRRLVLLAMSLACMPAMAQTQAADICRSGLCSSHGKTVDARPAEFAGVDLRGAKPDPAREWKQHMQTRDGAEAYNCALSAAVGGELKRDGYVGARMFGRSLIWNRPGAHAAR